MRKNARVILYLQAGIVSMGWLQRRITDYETTDLQYRTLSQAEP